MVGHYSRVFHPISFCVKKMIKVCFQSIADHCYTHQKNNISSWHRSVWDFTSNINNNVLVHNINQIKFARVVFK